MTHYEIIKRERGGGRGTEREREIYIKNERG
jgi:hypothetical protein